MRRVWRRRICYSIRRRNISNTIDRFILPKKDQKLNLNNKPLIQLFNNWNLEETDNLPLKSPIDLNPYEFHSRFNEDISYITHPRLSVTKLLTDRWCDLREYYTIYASSPRYKSSPQLQLGLDLHQKLELELHHFIDTEILSLKLEDIIIKKDLSSSSLINGYIKESESASDISEKIIIRLFKLVTTSECREVLTHGFLDTECLQLVYESSSISEKNILISGIIDSLTLKNAENKDEYSLFEDIQNYMKFNYKIINDIYLVDLFSFLPDVREILFDYRDNYKVQVTDVKTRSFNKIPSQESVLNSSKIQTFYYLKFLKLLSQGDAYFGYTSLMRNLEIKGCDLDAPINIKTLIILLRKHLDLFLLDFLKLARGEPIGFEPYDDYAKNNYINYEYNVELLLDNEDLKFLSEEEYNFELIKELLCTWKFPLTLRYFIARASQFYRLLNVFESDTTTIEYHNNKTGYCFQEIEYQYNDEELKNHIRTSGQFWIGLREPNFTDDLSKCKYCEFESKCTIPNLSPNNRDIGVKLKEFLRSAT